MEPSPSDVDAASRRLSIRATLTVAALVTAVAGGAGWYHFVIGRNGASSDRTDRKAAQADKTVPGWRNLEGYLGSQACRDCHPSEYRSYLETPHSRALTEV